MTRRKGSSENGKRPDPNAGRAYYCLPDAKFGGYVDIRIPEGEKGSFDMWLSDEAVDKQAMLEDAIGEGMSLSVRWSAEANTYLASLSGAGVSNSSERFVLTARSPVYGEAVGLLIYKHYMLCDGTWDNYKPRTGQLELFG